MSKWNSRGWTLQEYHPSKVIRIYTKDWTPYLGLMVFSKPLSDHIPPAIPDTITSGLHASELDFDLVARLYVQVNELPTSTFAAQRMRLPCLAFRIRTISCFQNGPEVVFRARAGALGVVEIKSGHDLAGLDSLRLVHPWIDFLLDRHATKNIAEITREDGTSELDEFLLSDSLDHSSASDTDSLDDAESLPSPTILLMNAQIGLLARLRQPFGALLPAPTRRNMAEHKRIATESLITVRVQGITLATLNRLIRGVRVLDVL